MVPALRGLVRIIEHTPTRLVVGTDNRGPRLWGALFLLAGAALIGFAKPRSPISLGVGAFFVLSGLGALRRPHHVAATFDRAARLLRLDGDSVRIPLGDITGLRLVHFSHDEASGERSRRIPVFVEFDDQAALLGFVSSPEDPALKAVQQFLVLSSIEETDLGLLTSIRRFLMWTALRWGVSATRLTALAAHWRRAAGDLRRVESRSCCMAQSHVDRAFCRDCGALLVDAAAGVRAPLGSRGLAALVEPMLVAAVVASAWYVGTPLPNGGVRIDGMASWALLAIPIAYAMLWPGGSSPGKQLLGLRVVMRRSGRPPGLLRMAGRELLGKTLSTILLGSGFLVAARDADHRALHDRLFGTVVVLRQRRIRASVETATGETTDEMPAMR